MQRNRAKVNVERLRRAGAHYLAAFVYLMVYRALKVPLRHKGIRWKLPNLKIQPHSTPNHERPEVRSWPFARFDVRMFGVERSKFSPKELRQGNFQPLNSRAKGIECHTKLVAKDSLMLPCS